MEPQQSPLYARFIRRLGWVVESVDGVNVFFKRFPLIGGMAKIHRPRRLPSARKLIPLLTSHNIKRLVVEPSMELNQKRLTLWCRVLSEYVSINSSPFLPTKTIHIDLTPGEEDIFGSFSEAKRRAVRRATKLGVAVSETPDIAELIRIKNTSAGLFGFITTTGIRELYETFSPRNAAILLARHNQTVIGGVLMIYWEKTAYYWIAGATKQGKRLFAPTVLAWEVMRLSKRRGSTVFDFVGAWDERIPRQNTEWKGFTKFKEGFGGEICYYPLAQTSAASV